MGIDIAIESVQFNTIALANKAKKEDGLDAWMKENLERGFNKDYEATHLIWGTTLNKGEEPKDMLLDPGVAKIMGYMGVRPRHIDDKLIFDKEGGHTTVTMKSELVTILPILYTNPRTGDPVEIYPVIAEGVGACTTMEKRFKVKWENQSGRGLIAAGYTSAELEALRKTDRLVKDDPDIKKALFYMPDPDAQGAVNTLVKMAAKRAEMDAVFQIPGIAQRFSQELDITESDVDDEGKRVVNKPEEKTETPPKKDWDHGKSSQIEMKYRLTPKQQREMCTEIIENSDGLVTTYTGALSVLLRRLEKAAEEVGLPEQKPPEQGFTPANQEESEPLPEETDDEEEESEEEESVQPMKDFGTDAGIEKRKEAEMKDKLDKLLYDVETVIENELGGIEEIEITEVKNGFNLKPKRFLGDRWKGLDDELKNNFAVSWKRDGKNSRWEMRI